MKTLTQSQQETIMRLMQNAVDAWPQFDNPESEVSGADLVEWFALWRNGVKATLEYIDRDEKPREKKYRALPDGSFIRDVE